MVKNPRISLIGAGIMSATLGILIKQLMPNAIITIYERLDRVGAESSDAWNNAGTGHSAFCELNYTPERENGQVDISKALRISESFEVSKQLWAYLLEKGLIKTDSAFINDIDHMSFVWGEDNKSFLKNRFDALIQYGIFQDMKYSESFEEISEWVPLMMNGRNKSEIVSATRMEIGTDVNFGAITRGMIKCLENEEGVELHLGHEVEDIKRIDNGWLVEVKDLKTGDEKTLASDFVFIGAGGGAIPLLEKTDIPEGRGYAGFPVSGQFLKCVNPEVVLQHEAKVYLLFGPYAGFSTKFLKNGSYLDLPLSIEMHNIWPMLSAGVHNISLTKYLVTQVMQSQQDRFDFLKLFYPEAKYEDWELIKAGQRVQIIKKDDEEGGVLKFGTEIVTNEDNTLAALLGASPGASTSVSIMLDVLNVCFEDEMKSEAWQKKIKEMIPSYGESLIEDVELCRRTREMTTKVLKLS